MKTLKKVAIIGAGLTGITIARELNTKFNVTIFEKSRGVGGRMATRRVNDFEFDHGAQFFTAKSQAFAEFIEPMIDKGIVSRWDARFIELNGTEVTSKRTWDQLFPHFVGNPGMNAFCKYLSIGLDIRLNTRIKLITADNNWRLFDANDNDLSAFDWVIITAPPEQTSQLMPINFKFIDKLKSIKMMGCYSLMLGFDKKPMLNFDAAMVHHADISWISANSSKPGRSHQPTLLINSTNEWADAHIDADDTIVVEYLLQELKRLTGLDASNAISQTLQRWRFANIGKQPNHNGFIDYDQKLAACGDWCIQGRVESAFLIGRTVANSILMV